MNDQTGKIAFVYNTQLGFTDGTLGGTTFMAGNPRVYNVLGMYNRNIYFREYVSISTAGVLMASDGTAEGTRTVLEQAVVSKFIYFNGKSIVRYDSYQALNFGFRGCVLHIWRRILETSR